MRQLSILLALLAWQVALAGEYKVGYNFHQNYEGSAHGILGEVVFSYFESGLLLGYGKKPVVERETGDRYSAVRSNGGADVLRLNVPLKVKYGRWPYLKGQIGYERILHVSGLSATAASGFGKSNEVLAYYGGGYEHKFRKVGVYLEGYGRSFLTDPDKTRYYRPRNPKPGSTYQISARGSSELFWEAGLSYSFSLPAGRSR